LLQPPYASRQARLAYAEPRSSAPKVQFFSEDAISYQVIDLHGVSSQLFAAAGGAERNWRLLCVQFLKRFAWLSWIGFSPQLMRRKHRSPSLSKGILLIIFY
jgi:hypothetical protein